MNISCVGGTSLPSFYVEIVAEGFYDCLSLLVEQIQAVEFAVRGASIVSCGGNLMKVLHVLC